MILEKNISEFIDDAENLVIGAVTNDDFVKITTTHGNAVLISEAEWNIMVEAMKMILKQA